jgi:enoyl-CoA hydratase/carnithine racemase
MSYETLLVEHDGPVGWLIFNRPDVGNAMNAAMFDELARAWIDLDQNPDVRVVVVTGKGKAFNTGLDIASLAREPESLRKVRREMRDYDMHFTARHQQVAKPVIAAVNGVCAGGGLQFVTDSDIAVCSSNASFLDPHVSVGQTVGYSAFTLARTIPFSTAMRLALTGRHERISAARALEVGLVGQVVDPPEDLREKAQALAETIARNSPTALALSKQALWRTLQMGLDDACRAGSLDIAAMWDHPDQAEGPAAFAQKREAQWQPPATGHH